MNDAGDLVFAGFVGALVGFVIGLVLFISRPVGAVRAEAWREMATGAVKAELRTKPDKTTEWVFVHPVTGEPVQ